MIFKISRNCCDDYSSCCEKCKESANKIRVFVGTVKTRKEAKSSCKILEEYKPRIIEATA